MRYPEGYLWEYPGFPAIAISYLKTNDFFFSGHVGLPIILGFEFRKVGCNSMFYFAIFIVFVEAFTMIVTRGHYIIDLITGVIVAHYIFILVSEYIHYVDDSCVSMNWNRETSNKMIDEEIAINKDNKAKDI
jgi:hypothetical protein